MNTKDWKQNELNRLLMEKFNLSSPELEEEVEIEEGHCGDEGKRDEEDLEEGKDQDDDGDSGDFADVQMARMKASGMSDEEAKEKTRKHND
jgi:hypothetical protein